MDPKKISKIKSYLMIARKDQKLRDLFFSKIQV